MKELKEYFKKTDYGYEDTRSLIPNINQWFKDNNIKAKAKKESLGMKHYGGKVTGESRGTINVNIETKERFDLTHFFNEFEKCDFRCLVPGRMFLQSYVFNITINEKSNPVYSDKGNIIGSKFREGKITEDMVWLYTLEEKDYGSTYRTFLSESDIIKYKSQYQQTSFGM